MSKRNEERIAFTQYSPGRERESARERLLRDRAVKGGGGDGRGEWRQND